MFYRDLIKRSWSNTWKNKYLWFFGLFAAMLGSAGETSLVFRATDPGPGDGAFGGIQKFLDTGVFSKQGLVGLRDLLINEPLTFFILISIFVTFLFLVVFMAWISTVSQVAVVSGCYKETLKKKHDFKGGLDVGLNKFLPVFGLNIFSKILVYLLFVVLGFSVLKNVGGEGFSSSALFILVAYLVILPLIVIVSFVIRYAIAYVVIKGERVEEAVKKAFKLFKKNWIITIEMALITLFFNFLAAITMVILLAIVSVPFLFVTVVFSKLLFALSFWVVLLSAGVLFFGTVTIFGSIVSVFEISLWTNLFLKLVGEGMKSKMDRTFKKKK